MSSPETQYIAYLNYSSAQINRYFSIFTFVFGITGNLLNILIFSRHLFRKNPCAIFFLNSSIANLIALFSGLTSRMLNGWAVDLTNTDRFICKFRTLILNVARAASLWLILLAIVDRWLISNTSVHLRRLSSWQNALKSSLLTLILSTMIFSHIIYCYEANMINTPLKCYGATLACRLVTDLCFSFVTTLIPISLMLVFSLLTIRNIRLSRQRVQSTYNRTMAINQEAVFTTQQQNQQQQQRPRKDAYLLPMALAEVALLFVFAVPLAVQRVYTTVTPITSSLELSVNNFGYNIIAQLHFFTNALPFYIYTLVGGRIFREELLKMFSEVKRRMCCR